MPEQDKPKGAATPLPSITPVAQAAKPEEKIIPPKEYSSENEAVKIIIDGDDIVIDFIGRVAEDIGCYRSIKKLRVQFKEGQGIAIIPMI